VLQATIFCVVVYGVLFGVTYLCKQIAKRRNQQYRVSSPF
jgi:hypothetical protein